MTGTAGQKRVPDTFISNFYSPIPPIGEQLQIVEYLERESKRLDDLSTKVKSAIERLGEYRAALVSTAVTGKIQVKDEGRRMKVKNKEAELNS